MIKVISPTKKIPDHLTNFLDPPPPPPAPPKNFPDILLHSLTFSDCTNPDFAEQKNKL